MTIAASGCGARSGKPTAAPAPARMAATGRLRMSWACRVSLCSLRCVLSVAARVQ